jgi:zinc transport system ATP-binding protein
MQHIENYTENKDYIVEIENVSFSYGKNEVLQGISFGIPRGDYLGIIGPNGGGKTTLLKIVLGLLTPSQGTVRLFGKDIRQFKDWPNIGYVPQKVTSFDEGFPATVYEIVLMGRYGKRGLFHRITAEDRRITTRVLEQVGMWEYKDRLIGDLSGGQQQRVFIARALATEPEIIFLDEPTVGIDQKTSREFYALLKKLNKEFHITLVLISHDLETVLKEVEHVACVDRALVCHTIPEEFLKDVQASKLLGEGVRIITHDHHH